MPTGNIRAMATMQPITAPHDVWMRLDGKGILAEAPDDKDSHQLLAKKGDHISVRAQLLYGLTIEDGRIHGGEYDARYVPTEEDSGDVPGVIHPKERG